jgi:iduronate 2-sulfatase
MKTAFYIALLTFCLSPLLSAKEQSKYNILFVIADDLTSTALACYDNKVCKTPNIDKLANEGTLFSRAYAQATFCGPSRASLMFGYYTQATGSTGYVSGREAVGPNRYSWTQYFRKNGWQSTRISKVFHMGVPPDIAKGTDGSDDPESWDIKFNSQGPEARAPGDGETMQNNPDEIKKVAGGNKLVNVAAEGDDLVHSDGKTAKKAIELIKEYKTLNKPWFLAVGFVRPHVPFVAPKKYFDMYPWEKMVLPPKIKGDHDDIPKSSLNSRTSWNWKMNIRQQKKVVSGYYASVTFMDDQFGKVMRALEETGQRKNTIVIFTSDHGYHLGEHDLWMKVSVHEESAKVPLIISVPGKKPAVCSSLTELLDLYPTTASLCGLPIPGNLQGKDLAPIFDNPSVKVRDVAICSSLTRTERWAYLYGKGGGELYDMDKDPQQYTNLAKNPEYAPVLKTMVELRQKRLAEIMDCDIEKKVSKSKRNRK